MYVQAAVFHFPSQRSAYLTADGGHGGGQGPIALSWVELRPRNNRTIITK
jgi:hypothetical protein